MTTTRWHGGEREASGGAKARSLCGGRVIAYFYYEP